MLNIIDLCIILVILFGGLIGYKRGFIKQGVITLGTGLVLILSFLLKNPISLFMYKHLPFFNFDIVIKNASVLNILVYETIAFLICFSILEVLLIILIKLSTVVELILKATVILEVPSKIFGAILGFIEGYFIVYILLFIIQSVTIPFNNQELIEKSKLNNKILTNTIFISKITKPTINSFNEIKKLIDDKDNLSIKEFNCKSINILIKNKFITKDSVIYLYDNNKINTKCDL